MAKFEYIGDWPTDDSEESETYVIVGFWLPMQRLGLPFVASSLHSESDRAPDTPLPSEGSEDTEED